VNPRDPSSVDAEIDLRAQDPGGEASADLDGAAADADEDIDDIDDGPDPDNPFSLGPGADPDAELPPPGVMVRRRGVAQAGRPLGPENLRGPIAGADGSLDLTEVHPADDVDAGPDFLPIQPSRRRWWRRRF
jgi:hypothetical protein